MAHRKYTDADRAKFLVALAKRGGSVPLAAADRKLPRSTAQRWANRAADARLTVQPEHTRTSEPAPLDTSWHGAFISELAKTANASAAAKAAGVGRTTAYEHREADPAFAALWAEAEAIADDAVIAEVRRRAMDGVDEPVFYQGAECGQIRRYSDAMLTILARHAHGGMYRERQESKVEQTGTMTVIVRREDRPIRGSNR